MTLANHLFVLLILGPLSAIWFGLALSTLWGWFLAPLGLPAINIPTAIGISLIATLLTRSYRIEPSEDDASKRASLAFLFPMFAAILGFIVKQFV